MRDYVDKFCWLNARNNSQETKVQLVSHFLNGLKDTIRDELDLHTIWTLFEVVDLAQKVEAKIARQAT